MTSDLHLTPDVGDHYTPVYDVRAAVDQQLQMDRRMDIAAKKTQLLSDRQVSCQDESLFASKFKLDLNWTNVWNSKTQRYSQTDFGIYVVRGGAKRNLKPGLKMNRDVHTATERTQARAPPVGGKRKFCEGRGPDARVRENVRRAVENGGGAGEDQEDGGSVEAFMNALDAMAMSPASDVPVRRVEQQSHVVRQNGLQKERERPCSRDSGVHSPRPARLQCAKQAARGADGTSGERQVASMQSTHYDVGAIRKAAQTSIIARAFLMAVCLDCVVSEHEEEPTHVTVPQPRHKRKYIRKVPRLARDPRKVPRLARDIRKVPTLARDIRKVPTLARVNRKVHTLARDIRKLPKLGRDIRKPPTLARNIRKLPTLARANPVSKSRPELLPLSLTPPTMMSHHRDWASNRPGQANCEGGPVAAQSEMQSQMRMPAPQYGAAMDVGQLVQPVESRRWHNPAPQCKGYGYTGDDTAGMYCDSPPVVQDLGPRLNPLLAQYVRDTTPVQPAPRASVVIPNQPRFPDLRPLTPKPLMTQAVQQLVMVDDKGQFPTGAWGYVSNHAMVQGHTQTQTQSEAVMKHELLNTRILSVLSPRW